jgi:hypothetical protein
MWGIIEPISAGFIVALINIYIYIYIYIYIIGKNIFESCMVKQEDDDDECVSISTTVSDASSIQHIHV